MKRHIFAALVLLGLAGSAKADTSLLTTADGWTRITTLPTATDIANNYYVFVDNTHDLMLGVGKGVNQNTKWYSLGVFYQTSVSPTSAHINGKTWTLETQGNGFAMRNLEYSVSPFQTEWGAAWKFDTNDVYATANEWCEVLLAYTDGAWTVQNGKYPDAGYLGPWTNGNFTAGAECAVNKTGNNIGKFQIYAISRERFKRNLMSSASADNPVDLTPWYVTNATFDANSIEGWTAEGEGNNFNYDKTGCEIWHRTDFKIYQKVTVPKGTYKVSVQATGSTSGTLYGISGASTSAANATEINKDNFQNTVLAMIQDRSYGKITTGEITVSDGSLTIGFKDETTSQWDVFDNFKLYCTGVEQAEILKADREVLLAALDHFETHYNLVDGTDYSRQTMSEEAWTSLINQVNVASLALDDTGQAANYNTLANELMAQMEATDASMLLFSRYQTVLNAVIPVLGTSAAEPSDTDTDATLLAAIDRLNAAYDNYTVEADYTHFLTAERGFTEVTSIDDIVADDQYCYILASAETTALYVGVGAYQDKPGWAGEETKALRYRSALGDPVLDLSNFFTIEQENGYIGLRNVYYSTSLFQTHDGAGFMYVLTYTEPTMSDWCYLTPACQDGYWTFENGKYPMSSDAYYKGFLGPWNKRVADGEPIAANRTNVAGDEAGHYRLFRISRADLVARRNQLLQSVTPSWPINATWRITNPSFETGDETGWTLTGKDPAGNDEFKVRGDYTMTNKDGNCLMNAFQWWASSLSVSQTVSGLPAGQYQLSGVVATWEGRTVTFSANEVSATQQGQGEDTGIRVNADVTIGSDGQLTITVGSTGQWWVEGREGETRTFFKLDDVQLRCKRLFLDAYAMPLPNDNTPLTSGQWYYFETDYSTEYQLVGNLEGLVYSTAGNMPAGSDTETAAQRVLTLPVGRTYFKTTVSGVSLVVMPYRNVEEGTFTAVALNVDGLPNTIATVELNPDGPGADGTKKISQYLASKNYDFIGCSEDFNYHGSLMSSLTDGYSSATVRATLSVGDLPWSQMIQGKFRFDTDGLNLIWKNAAVAATNESWTQWNDMESTDGNQYVKKGYRHYDMYLSANAIIDVYVLHMDAGDTNATWSRESQWRQLADAINASDHNRAKLIIGDTNSRWTREDIIANFNQRLDADLSMSDVWVELYRNGIYPTTDEDDLTDQSEPTNYTNYEIVDKIIYINPTAANTVRLTPQAFRIEQDYTYGTVEGTDNTTPLGDHRPVVVTFKYQLSGEVTPTSIVLYDDHDNASVIAGAAGVLADVTLQGRTLFKDGSWNTLCLPFDISPEMLNDESHPLYGAAIKELGNSDGCNTGFEASTGVLHLDFLDAANGIRPAHAYIVKWDRAEDYVSDDAHNLVNPTFVGVRISDEDPAENNSVTSSDGAVTFQGLYSPLALAAGDQARLYMGDGNNLYYSTEEGFQVGAFRAYFQLNLDVAAVANVRSIVLDFGDGEISEITGIAECSDHLRESMVWYTLDGRRLLGKPTRRGVYINGNRKVVIP